ncbi:ead/Ea22-like family protein [Klebsiella pneumoniae]|nr:ead/Ea22-like family protein [Klebsiella pneumoniae]
MTDITELAQRIKAAANKAGADDWQAKKISGDFYVIRKGSYSSQCGYCTYQPIAEIDHKPTRDYMAMANPANILTLVDALEKAQQRNAELEAQNEYIRKRYQQLDLLIGKNILVMQAAIIEWQATGDAKNGLAWIYNTLFGPGELPDEAEKDAQAYFDRKYAPLDEELMALHKWFWEQSEAERAAAGIKVEAE